MEGHCSTGQSTQWAVVPMEEEEEDDDGQVQVKTCSTDVKVTNCIKL